ncbi:MAG: carbon monoxide dehydrogenase subunit G [Chloroflexi bacterium]|nr:carbon monoxide dehydrogenase subunit G [Chloroflexota bacterium]MBI3762586.1 carbon monoxide dehydrogenase subunit G [Chloroflexota bacterium]
MHLEGTTTITAPREKVWKFLTDPNFVSKCAPGLETMEIVTPDKQFRAVASIGFGTVKARFVTDVEWLELDEPNRAKMKAHGTAPGSAMDAVSEMFLTQGANGATEMKWTADVVVVGTIASLASRMMGSVTQKLTAAFFDCVKKQIEA